MGRSRYHFLTTNAPHFVTCSTVDWLPVFSKPELASMILNSLAFLQERNSISLHAYVLMENHLHLIASAENLSREIASFKSFTARSIIDWLKVNTENSFFLTKLEYEKRSHKTGQTYQLWQEGSHPQMINSSQMLDQKINYIHDNPVKRGYVDRPECWRYSSARNYAGEPGLLEVVKLW